MNKIPENIKIQLFCRCRTPLTWLYLNSSQFHLKLLAHLTLKSKTRLKSFFNII